MSRENNLNPSTPFLATEPTVTTTFRGYNRREVDQYASLLESHVAASVAERQELQARVRALTDELHKAHAELVELRRRPSPSDKVTFRHLGMRVEQILAEAEQQAEEMRREAAQLLDRERAKFEAEVGDAKLARDRVIRECELEIKRRRAAAENEIAQMRADVAVDLENAKQEANRIRAEAQAVLKAARDEAERLRTSAAAAAERLRADAIAHSTEVREAAEREAAAIAQSAETYAHQTREAAEVDAKET